ncbi:MAG: GxxExxY protein [Crocinitomicaceae bacterium]|nr:MAG: GxxExxY protein [Crocinitomicaceae bacterium]
MNENELSNLIIGCAIEVHRTLGPGLLESVYENCLLYELEEKGIFVERQVELPIEYKDKNLEVGYKIDLLVENKVIIELKSVKEIQPIHVAQLMTYLKLSDNRLGLLINFNEVKLVDGLKRIVNNI